MALIFPDSILLHLGVLYRHELHNAYVYSKISNFLNVEGFKNIAKYYQEWSQHEISHSISVKDFCDSNNINIDMSISIDPINIDLKNESIVYFSKLTLETENLTTDLYNKLLELGEENNNGFVKKFAYNFLEEQIEETDKALTLYDSIKNIGEDRKYLQLFDNTFNN